MTTFMSDLPKMARYLLMIMIIIIIAQIIKLTVKSVIKQGPFARYLINIILNGAAMALVIHFQLGTICEAIIIIDWILSMLIFLWEMLNISKK